MLAVLLPLMLAAAQQPEAEARPDVEPIPDVQALIERNALEGAFLGFYAPYQDGGALGVAAWEVPHFSAETTALIAQWRRSTPSAEVDDLRDGDWLCQCQELDSTGFTARIERTEMHGKDSADLDIAVDLGFADAQDSARSLRLLLKRESEVWKIDDILAASFPRGLKQALREAIAAGSSSAGERG
jgi:hypothetical protein